MNTWASPLKPEKVTKAKAVKEEVIKPVKCRVSNAGAKAIVASKRMDDIGSQWVERWIEQFVRENSYPPQLVGNDFIGLLGKYLEPKRAIETLEKIRKEFARSFSWDDGDADFEYLLRAIANDPVARDFIEKENLGEEK